MVITNRAIICQKKLNMASTNFGRCAVHRRIWCLKTKLALLIWKETVTSCNAGCNIREHECVSKQGKVTSSSSSSSSSSSANQPSPKLQTHNASEAETAPVFRWKCEKEAHTETRALRRASLNPWQVFTLPFYTIKHLHLKKNLY